MWIYLTSSAPDCLHIDLTLFVHGFIGALRGLYFYYSYTINLNTVFLLQLNGDPVQANAYLSGPIYYNITEFNTVINITKLLYSNTLITGEHLLKSIYLFELQNNYLILKST